MNDFSRLNQPCPVAEGTRVRVTGILPDDPCPLPVGLEGTVVGGNGCQIWVDWDDSDRSLCLLPEDPFEVIPSN